MNESNKLFAAEVHPVPVERTHSFKTIETHQERTHSDDVIAVIYQ